MNAGQGIARRVWVSGALLVVALFACFNPPLSEIEFESGPDAEVTADGLHRVKNPAFGAAWAKPDADFAAYDKLILDLVSVSYKREPRGATHQRTGSNFVLTEEQMENLKRRFRGAFEEELSKSEHYELVETPGPRVLRANAAIIDLVVTVPPQSSVGRETVYTSSTGEMTLLMELRDSLSGEILARVADRREARSAGSAGGNTLYYSGPGANTYATRQIFRGWAQILRARLDQFHQLQPTQSPPETE